MAKRMYNNTMNRGTVGRAKRKFKNWWNKAAIEKEQIRMSKEKRERARQEKKELAAQHWEAEKIKLKREEQVRSRLNSRGRSREQSR